MTGHQRIPDLHPRRTLEDLYEDACGIEEYVGAEKKVKKLAGRASRGEDPEELESDGESNEEDDWTIENLVSVDELDVCQAWQWLYEIWTKEKRPSHIR